MKINIKDYIDIRISSLEKYIDSNLTSDRKAVDQYSKTNDEWKTMHNGLQRKMEEDRSQYVTREALNKQTLLIISIIGAVLAIYEAFIR